VRGREEGGGGEEKGWFSEPSSVLSPIMAIPPSLKLGSFRIGEAFPSKERKPKGIDYFLCLQATQTYNMPQVLAHHVLLPPERRRERECVPGVVSFLNAFHPHQPLAIFRYPTGSLSMSRQ